VETEIEKASIHIEIVSWGQVHQMGDKFFFIAGKNNVEIPKSEVVTFKNFYREWYFYHAYTQEQISSLRELILYLVKEFKIRFNPDYLISGTIIRNFYPIYLMGYGLIQP
jgi:hypothetical protein